MGVGDCETGCERHMEWGASARAKGTAGDKHMACNQSCWCLQRQALLAPVGSPLHLL